MGRSEERLARLRDELVGSHGEDRFPLVIADMGSLASVRAAVARILETEPRLDVVVDNAGAIFPERVEGPDGIEATLAVLVVGPFALIGGLLPLLRRTAGLAGHRRDVRRHVHPATRPRRPAAPSPATTRVRAHTPGRSEPRSRSCASGPAGSPGPASSFARCTRAGPTRRASPRRCPAFYRLMRPLLRTPAEGADTIIWLATHPGPGVDERPAVPRSPAAAVRPRPVDAAVAPPTAGACGTRWWSWLGGPDPEPAA